MFRNGHLAVAMPLQWVAPAGYLVARLAAFFLRELAYLRLAAFAISLAIESRLG
ncbi:hypothetical protein D3C76_889090 [compost metagenome]